MTPAVRFLKLRSVLLVLVALALVAFTGCGDGGGGGDVDADAPETDMTDGSPDVIDTFDDHTVSSIEDMAAFEALSIEGSGRRAMKFVITEFLSRPAMRYMDSNFYTLHDEWYWFRLLNGALVPGGDEGPLVGYEFATIDDIYTWAKSVPELPLNLRFLDDGRLYSSNFYALSLQRPRSLGLGTLIHVPARTEPEVRPEFWLFELEYSDRLNHDELVHFFQMVEATMPADIGPLVKWVVRSPDQDVLAVTMERDQLEYWDRVVRWSDVIIPGDIEVYAEGITAGRLKVVASGEPGLESSRSTDILVTEDVPDWLPPAAGLITATPQTPLAHVNVLARNRGIPNAFLGGVIDDPEIDQLSRVSAPVIVRAVAPDQLDITPMSESQYQTWRSLGDVSPIAVPQVDPSTLNYTVDLGTIDASTLTEAELGVLRPIIGGKAAGFLSLAAPGTVTMPETPMVITVRAYMEHMVSLDDTLQAMLADIDFRTSARARFLMLEGTEDYDLRYQSDEDRQFKLDYYIRHPAGTLLGEVLRADGFKKTLRDRALAPNTMSLLRTDIESRFGDYAPTQGLRFRSSSSVEDIEGFNGAGLYDSNTGFFDPSIQMEAKDRKKTLEWAIKKTWSSYWSFEAFEERALEKVDHLSGGMAVLVHARFDDPMEVCNGVFTFTLYPAGHPTEMAMDLNVQDGDESVTNPTPGLNALPEVDRVVVLRGQGTPSIERVAGSSLVPAGTHILTDAQLLEIFAQAQDVNSAWLARENQALGPENAASTLTLDYEFREMAEGWPALSMGMPFPQRIVIKQARSLEPGLRHIPDTLSNLPFPRDVLARTRRGERRVCTSDVFTAITVDVTTDPIVFPDMGYSTVPFTSFVSLRFDAAVPLLGIAAGTSVVTSHLEMEASHPGMLTGGPWTLDVTYPSGAVATLTIDGGNYTVGDGMSMATGTVACENEVLLTTPEDYLLSLLDE